VNHLSNFDFLKSKWPDLAKTGQLAEQYLYTDPNSCIFKTRLFAEKLVDLFLVFYKVETDIESNLYEKINQLSQVKSLNPAVINLFTLIRRNGNKAAHDNYVDINNAKESLESIFKLSAWFFVRVTGFRSAIPKQFSWPEKALDKTVEKETEFNYFEEIEKVKEELNQAHKIELEALKKQLELSQPNIEKVEQDLAIITNELGLTEAETRVKLIDAMLKEAGWDVGDSDQVKTELPVRPFPNPSGQGFADYVLYDRVGKPIAVVESKKTAESPTIGQHQAKLYADALEQMYQVRPVIYYTNGHETWMWDDAYREPCQVWGFYTLDDIEFLMLQHKNKKSLRTVQIDPNIAGRAYQIEGIKRIYEAYESGCRRALMVMATGSGKTRTAISLVKGLLQMGWVKRVLFLADRDELVQQAMERKNSFKVFLPDSPRHRITSQTVNDRRACIYFATYQTMIKYYDQYSVGFFDLIIADESHRSIYKTYRDILEYYDAYLLGLTATPVDFINRNTFNFFSCPNGDPTFHYSYEEAYNHVPPYLLRYKPIEATTNFLRQGIHWDELTEEQKRQLEEDGLSEEQIDFDRDALEQFVTNYETNAFILQTLMNRGIKVGDTIGKSIIFARNIVHADFLLRIFNELYPQYKGKLAAIIHSKIKNHEDLLNDFKEKDRPRIAISVDMLDTGIDVPEVVNLSFAKPVYSKVKFLQMIGRGTRTWDNLFGSGKDKEHFTIFDHWQNFRFFNINPEGELPSESKSSLQVRFELRIKLLEQFLREQNQERQAEMISLLRGDITALPERSIEIKKKWKSLEWLKLDQTWQLINDNLLNVLKLEIAPLMQWIDVEGQLDAIWFDNEMHRMEYLKLTRNRNFDKQVEGIIFEFQRLKLNLNQFNGVREYVVALMKPETWTTMGYEELENCRKTLRDLMKFRGALMGGPFLKLNIVDGGYRIEQVGDQFSAPTLNMDEYIKRVETALKNEMQMQLVIYKIRKGEKLTEFDSHTVYQLFDSGKFDFTLEEMAENSHIKKDDLDGLLRKFIGVDEAELNKRFEFFIYAHPSISATQMKILDMIKNDIIKNRGISFASLYQEPYTSINNQGIDGIFADKRLNDEVISLIEPYQVRGVEYGN
jgi:type I restriction enzyme R subunit